MAPRTGQSGAGITPPRAFCGTTPPTTPHPNPSTHGLVREIPGSGIPHPTRLRKFHTQPPQASAWFRKSNFLNQGEVSTVEGFLAASLLPSSLTSNLSKRDQLPTTHRSPSTDDPYSRPLTINPQSQALNPKHSTLNNTPLTSSLEL